MEAEPADHHRRALARWRLDRPGDPNHRGLVLSDGDLTPFLTRPISATLGVICAATILMNLAAVRRLAHRTDLALMPRRRAA
jgi:hypothetical protein